VTGPTHRQVVERGPCGPTLGSTGDDHSPRRIACFGVNQMRSPQQVAFGNRA